MRDFQLAMLLAVIKVGSPGGLRVDAAREVRGSATSVVRENQASEARLPVSVAQAPGKRALR